MKTTHSPDEHLKGFVKSFIDPVHSDRWRHTLLEKVEKAQAELKKFERHLNTSACKLIEAKEIANLIEIKSASTGVYFDGYGEAKNIPLSVAYEIAHENKRDAIFSFHAGKEALFFFHEGWGWLCQAA